MRVYRAQPFLFPLSGVCENTPCFLRADCCGTLKRGVVNSSNRITSRPVGPCVAMSRLVTILVGFLLQVIKRAVFSSNLVGIYVHTPHLIRVKNNSLVHRGKAFPAAGDITDAKTFFLSLLFASRAQLSLTSLLWIFGLLPERLFSFPFSHGPWPDVKLICSQLNMATT